MANRHAQRADVVYMNIYLFLYIHEYLCYPLRDMDALGLATCGAPVLLRGLSAVAEAAFVSGLFLWYSVHLPRAKTRLWMPSFQKRKPHYTLLESVTLFTLLLGDFRSFFRHTHI